MEVTLGPRPTFCKLGRACAMGTSRMHRWNIFESKFAWAVAAACSALAGCSSEAPPAPPPAPEVGVITVRPQNIPNIIELPGRVQAIRTAEVRARVDGIVQRRLYEEGTDVRAGQALFAIDPRELRASLNAVEATLARARAAAANAPQDVNRYRTNSNQHCTARNPYSVCKYKQAI